MPEFHGSLHSKLPRVKTTVFTKMSLLAKKENALDLSQGYPDFDCHPELKKLVSEKIFEGHNQYAAMAGVPELRKAIVEKTEKLYGTKYDPENEITITSGATQAIYTAISSVVNEGDEVIIFTPAYDCYQPAIEINGGKPIFVRMQGPDYKINWDEVKKVVSQLTKMIIINTPHNPTGTLLSDKDMQNLEKITHNSDIIILSDEVYEHVVFDKKKHHSAASFPNLASRSFVISSLGKTFHTTGWKIGYCLAPKQLMKEFQKAHQYTVFSVNHPIQLAYAEFLQQEEHYLQLGKFYQQKRDYFLDLIKDSRFTFQPSAGSYFQLLDYSAINQISDIAFAERLVKQFKVSSIPVSVFYNKPTDAHVLRFCFAKKDETLEKAAEILRKL